MFIKRFLATGTLLLSLVICTQAQKNTPKKYPSLFWEITGNGMKKPSYLFGTMHVSSKLAFHLSDSFYFAMKNVDAVALELNPDLWQAQMIQLDRLKKSYTDFTMMAGNPYLNESSFRLDKYDNGLKMALSTEPVIVNSLLYRTYAAKEDFEEDTFLDLYIYQTGKKLGKRGTGVENYYESEKLIMQGYADMAKEKKKKIADTDGESFRDIGEKIQDAYKRGDLDLMDSLDIVVDRSPAFRESFLYKRNEIQANSMDSIMKKSALFVGVGAAHLPGMRGVIELLRKKGYILRPIKMQNRDAAQKDGIDGLSVPVSFSTIQSEDGFYKAAIPGPLYNMNESYQTIDRKQYADMSNGSYYIVSRIKTYAALSGQTDEDIKKKIDSLLYENIPGKILKKTAINRNGYEGIDILNKTRRGDLQRYHIFITPSEILIFKMSGKENYVAGQEANRFFSSIQLREPSNHSSIFSPQLGGFSVKLPQVPTEYLNTYSKDEINRWEYQATNKTTGDAYLILKKSLYNFQVLDEDSFYLKLVETSFRSSAIMSYQLNRKHGLTNGFPCLDVTEKLKDSSVIHARFIIKGAQLFALAVRSGNQQDVSADFFDSFQLTPYYYKTPKLYVDTFIHFSVSTPIAPALDEDYRAMIEKVAAEMANENQYHDYSSDFPKIRNALFKSDSTGEAIGVSVQQYPYYYSAKDSVAFWKAAIDTRYDNKDLVLLHTKSINGTSGAVGVQFELRDTGSSKAVYRMLLLKDNYLFSAVGIGDTITGPGSFISDFFSSFTPEPKKLGESIFTDKTDSFFADLTSKDSSIYARAAKAISSMHFDEKAVPKNLKGINQLDKKQKDYVEIKTKLIEELGNIQDSTQPVIVKSLQKIYDQSGDTSVFQNAVLSALATHQTLAAMSLFKELIMKDAPVFDNDYEYSSLIRSTEDSLALAATLFPDLLQLSSSEDYKAPVRSLLTMLVDSGFVKAEQYESSFNSIYFDAKIALKKMQASDEKKANNNKKNDDENSVVAAVSKYGSANEHSSAVEDFAILLMPFYDKNKNVPLFFERLLQSTDESVQLNTVGILLRNKKPVPDSLLLSLATNDLYRALLFKKLETIKRTDKFPAVFNTPQQLAKSFLVAENGFNKIDSVAYLSQQPISYKQKQLQVYFFKYRIQKEDSWKIGFSGLEKTETNQAVRDGGISTLTGKKLLDTTSEAAQLQEQLNKLLFSFHKSAAYFYLDDGYQQRASSIDD